MQRQVNASNTASVHMFQFLNIINGNNNFVPEQIFHFCMKAKGETKNKKKESLQNCLFELDTMMSEKYSRENRHDI